MSIFIRRSQPCNPLITIILVQSPAVCSEFRHVFIKQYTYFYHSTVNLVKDPVSIYQADILKITDHVGYFMTAHFCYYCIVNSDNYKIVIGPTSQVPNSTPTLRDLAMQLDIPGDDIDDFIIAMQDITHIPLESLMQLLCLLNYILNNEKCFLHDVFIDDAIQKQFIESMNKHDADMFFSDETTQSITLHNTYDFEQNVMNMVRKGDYMALTGVIEKSTALKIGTMSDNQLRQLRIPLSLQLRLFHVRLSTVA